MIKKLFLIGFLITFLFSSLALFIPILYLRYEIKSFLNRYLIEAVIQPDSEVKKNITSYLVTLDPNLEVIEIEVKRTDILALSLSYQQNACLGFIPTKPCLFPIRSKLIQSKKLSNQKSNEQR